MLPIEHMHYHVSDREMFEQDIDAYFDTKHSVSFGRSFDVIHPDTRQEAKDFIVQLCVDLGVLVLMDEESSDEPLDMGHSDQV